MYLTEEEFTHIFANRNRTRPDKTIIALAEMNCCSKKDIHIYLDCICESYRYADEVKKPMDALIANRLIYIEQRNDTEVLKPNGEFSLPWLFYLNKCVKDGKPFEDIVAELCIESKITQKEIERRYENWKIF